MDRYRQSYQEALDENLAAEKNLHRVHHSLLQTKENLNQFVKSHSLEIMVPIGKKAFVRGKLQHTNEVTVSHGSAYFSDCSGQQANEIIDNRVKLCEVQLQALEKERDLFTNKLELPQDAFAHAEGREEIIEEYDETAEIEWRRKHAESVKKQKLKEAQERQQISNQADFKKLFDDADLMEELAEELENLEIKDDNETLLKVLSGELKIPESKKRIAHNLTETADEILQRPVIKSTPDSNNNDLIAQNNQEIVDLLRTYRCKIKEVLKNVKKDDERNVNLFLDLIELKDDIEDDIRKMNDDEEDYSESDERDSDDETTASIDIKPPEDTKRKVRFSTSLEDVKLIESSQTLKLMSEQSEDNTIHIHFQHSNAKLSSEVTNFDAGVVVAHPGEILTKFKSVESPAPVRKSILKNKVQDEKLRETMEEKPVKKIFTSDIIGDVVEHKKDVAMVQEEIVHITAKEDAPRKVSKFKQMRQVVS